ncbi:MAG: outer membrane beta-barrel protein [Chitinophagaceae bacterium]|nr:outer membrane beta-barrel protein [Chitinophagaceae bacterium]
MKRFSLLLALFVISGNYIFAQTETDSIPKKKDWSKAQLSGRAADHFMLQLGYHGWGGDTKNINTKGFSRTFNMYFMYDFPFKSTPNFSAAAGVGVGTDNMFLKETTVDLTKSPLTFTGDTSATYKKYKLATTYLEIPVELRYTANPENFNKSFKAAIGLKVGTMVDAHTKAKISRDNEGNGNYSVRMKDRRNFNSTRLAATVRIGYGVFSLFGTYQINTFVRDGYGPNLKPYTIGLCISGL